MNTQVSVPISCLRPCLSERLPLKQFIRPSEHRAAEIIYEKIQRWKVKMFSVSGFMCDGSKETLSLFFPEVSFPEWKTAHTDQNQCIFNPPERGKKRYESHI